MNFVAHPNVPSPATPIELTGNPFVDIGLAVIASLKDLPDIADLTLETLYDVHSEFEDELLYINEHLKSFTMIFTTNSMLVHPMMRRTGMGKPAYKAVLNGVA